MVAPTFGFSVGDFVAVTGLIVAVVRALQGVSDDLVELKELQDELDHLKTVFEFIESAIFTGSAISVQNGERLLQTISRIQKVLNDFKKFIDKYAGTYAGMAKYRKRVAWSLWKKQQVEPFRRRLQNYATTLSIIQSELNR